MVINLKISGFSDQIFEFAKDYIQLLLESANEGFDSGTVRNSIEHIRTEYANNNIEVDDKATTNRILMLIPHTFHDKLMEKELSNQLKLEKCTFEPGNFLKTKILDNITSVQVLVFGNTKREDSVKFCLETVVPKFKTVKCYHLPNERCGIAAGCIFSQTKQGQAQQTEHDNSGPLLAKMTTMQKYKTGILGQITWDCLARDDENETEHDQNVITEEDEEEDDELPRSESMGVEGVVANKQEFNNLIEKQPENNNNN